MFNTLYTVMSGAPRLRRVMGHDSVAVSITVETIIARDCVELTTRNERARAPLSYDANKVFKLSDYLEFLVRI